MAAAAGVAVALTAIGLAVGSYAATRSTLRSEIDSALVARAEPFRKPPQHDAEPEHPEPHSGSGPSNVDTSPSPPFGAASGSVQFVSRTGKVSRPARDAQSALPVSSRAKAIAVTGTGRFFSDVSVRGIHLRVLTLGVGSRGAVQVARPLTEADRALDRLLLILIFAGGAGILVAVVLGAVVARTALAPVARFTRRTESLTANPDVSQRLEVTGKDELARLAGSFNATLDALERSVEAQRHLVADASHELRTPIASLRANIQTLEDAERLPPAERAALRDDIISELDELTGLVGDLVELARGSKPSDLVDDVRLDQIVTALVERAERRAAAGISFETALEPTVVRGEPERISRAVSNLLGNARKWSPAAGVVEIELRGGTLTVRDHGPGFGEQDLPHVFDRFYRAESARGMPGSGLGLAIVRQAAESHGGSVEAANAAGGGAFIRIRFGPSLSVAERAPEAAERARRLNISLRRE
jgi:two-component system, OmpR family, sensor histidine kinase MprB